MNYALWKILSGLNKAILPKIYKAPDLMKLSNLQKAIVGWKIFVTYRLLDAAKAEGKNIIKMKRTTPLFLSVALVGALSLMSHHNGVAEEQGKDRTGAPGSDADCEYCHQPGATIPVSSVAVMDANGLEVNEYMPNTQYDVEFRVESNWAVGYGFQGTAVISGGDNAGIFTEPGTNVQLENVGGRHIVEHSDVHPSGIFTVKWTSPAEGTGDVAFYNSGLAVNGAYGNGGDAYHGTAMTITEQVSSVDEFAQVEVSVPYSQGGEIVWNAHTKGTVRVFDLGGKLVESVEAKEFEQVRIQTSKRGLFVVTFQGTEPTPSLSWKIAL